MKLNERNEYEFELNDILNLIPIDQSDIEEAVPHLAIEIKRWGRLLYRYIYMHINKGGKTYVQEKIIADENHEIDALKDSLVELLMGAYVSDMHMNAYLDKVTKKMPETIDMILRDGDLVGLGRFVGEA